MSHEETIYDVAVIGGGVIGCAILRKLTCNGYKCILLEKEAIPLTGASSGNSGLVHTGFDSEPGTKELHFHKLSQDINLNYYRDHCLQVHSDALLVAWNGKEVSQLSRILEKAHTNGIFAAKLLSATEILKLEPNLNKNLKGGVYLPGELIIDPFILPITMLHEAKRMGAQVLMNANVTSGTFDNFWKIKTEEKITCAKCVINAGGLYADQVESICHISPFSIKPRKGEGIIYPKSAGHLLKHIILPVPSSKTKGILVYPTIYGNIVIGPTAVDVTDRKKPVQVEASVVNQLKNYAQNILPGLIAYEPIGVNIGLRPATEHKDYRLYTTPEKNWITIGGIRSSGVTTCLSLADYALSELEGLNISPSGSKQSTAVEASTTWWPTQRGSIVMDGTEYTVTHPITKYGLWEDQLTHLKSKL